MRYLLDTNAVSEPQRPHPDRAYIDWLGEQRPQDLALSVITFGVLKRGVEALDPGRRQDALLAWLTEAVTDFGDRILPVDLKVAQTWGVLSARLKRQGEIVGVADELIAATCLAHGLALVTRNGRHFQATGCPIVSPWAA